MDSPIRAQTAITASHGALAVGHADRIAYYAEPPNATLLKRAALLAQKVAVVERTSRLSLLGPAGQAAEVPFTVRITVFRGSGDPLPGTLGALTDAYLRLPQRRMVITGVAGGGKTVIALELALLLLDHRQPEDPVPVRLSLAEWDPETPLESWLVRQVADTYSLRRGTAHDLVTQRLVLPLLDGLDEMDGEAGSSERAARALDQINRYHGLRGPAPLIVTCRSETYERLSRERGGLESTAVAAIEELDSRQIRAYLEHTLAARPHAEKLAWSEVIDNLHLLPAGTLSTPWRLYLATTVYSGGRDPRDLLTLADPTAIDRLLLERLIPTAVEASPHRRYNAERTIRWLTSIATHSPIPAARGGGSAPAADILLHRLAPVVGLKRVMCIQYGVAILFGALAYLAVLFRFDRITGRDLLIVAGAGLIWGAMIGGLGLHKAVEPVRLVRPRLPVDLARELLRMDITQTWRDLVNKGGQRAGPLLKRVSLVVIILTSLITPLAKWLIPAPTWGVAALVGLYMTLMVFVVRVAAWLLYALVSPILLFWELSFQEVDTQPVQHPGDALRQDLRFSAVAIAASAPWALLWPPALLLVTVVAPWIANRAWMRYAVTAVVGRVRGRLPLRPAPFLAWAHRAGLLRVTGRTYQFRHRALQEWLGNEARRRADLEWLARSARKRSLGAGQRLAYAKQLATLDGSEGSLALARLASDTKLCLHQRIMAMEARTVLHEELGEPKERDEQLALVRRFAEVPLLEADSYEYRWATDALTRLDPPTGKDLLTRLAQSAKAGRGSDDIRLWAAKTLTQIDPEAGHAALIHLVHATDLADSHRAQAAAALPQADG
ncbi:NACHT domain-containing protein [Kitasatospora sp. NPDC050463]|uniref:NACHT domain-containing protein n=1 Tax=Kitasatospora sp. NPDC050463 TaxID=3155786 RepID=UPI0033BFE60F